MPVDLTLLILAICLGAVVQVGIGIGFSILAGPPMMILLGTSTAVPVLLLLNTLVSAVATDPHVVKAERRSILIAILGCLIGVGIGLMLYPLLSEPFVLALTGCLLLIGLATSLVPLRRATGPVGFMAMSGLSGLATVWAAMPGPLMVLGLMAKGHAGRAVARLVQPIALVAYGVAFLLHGTSTLPLGPQLWAFVAATVFGSLMGRVVGPYLPQRLVSVTIRIISVLACALLFQRAYVMA
ncbi:MULTISPECIES: hypothetical protein [unclassified Ruegeria]|uniref:hypothetical protein n=1 Tax=unclassified Ruegeria TaxID=2625375 RepID=UPI0014881BBC|nr:MULTISPECIES: hypothetical protein [unclassified Ruegeria]